MVPCDTLQTLIGKEDLPRVRLIKIDVEGAEYDAIRVLLRRWIN
jgi:FkbM family methyltransferase